MATTLKTKSGKQQRIGTATQQARETLEALKSSPPPKPKALTKSQKQLAEMKARIAKVNAESRQTLDEINADIAAEKAKLEKAAKAKAKKEAKARLEERLNTASQEARKQFDEIQRDEEKRQRQLETQKRREAAIKKAGDVKLSGQVKPAQVGLKTGTPPPARAVFKPLQLRAVSVDSTCLSGIYYDGHTKTLYLEFKKSGIWYKYERVSVAEAQRMVDSPFPRSPAYAKKFGPRKNSLGASFNKIIRPGGYAYYRNSIPPK